ncbi:MAG: NAD(P)H-dependent oxidoreductase [Treponema sp.]|nr:NAD(P)H-dependent oxidoreductase [Treponema sp.]
MKTVIIHGQNHKGSTYHIAHQVAEKLAGEIQEFFLPKDFGDFCIGCCNCFNKSESLCPHYNKLLPITQAMDQADLIILASPVYVYHATGPMKAFLDHYGYRWMVHSPQKSMFTKQALVISTAAGAGTKTTNKDMADSLFFWGLGKIYKYGLAVAAINWAGVTAKKKASIDKATSSLAKKITRRVNKVKPGLKTRAFFFLMHILQRKGFTPKDKKYWDDMGWTGKARPWKN